MSPVARAISLGFEQNYVDSMNRMKLYSDQFRGKVPTNSKFQSFTATIGGTVNTSIAGVGAVFENVLFKVPVIGASTGLRLGCRVLAGGTSIVSHRAGNFLYNLQKPMPGLGDLLFTTYKVFRFTLGTFSTATLGLFISTQLNYALHVKLGLIAPNLAGASSKPTDRIEYQTVYVRDERTALDLRALQSKYNTLVVDHRHLLGRFDNVTRQLADAQRNLLSLTTPQHSEDLKKLLEQNPILNKQFNVILDSILGNNNELDKLKKLGEELDKFRTKAGALSEQDKNELILLALSYQTKLRELEATVSQEKSKMELQLGQLKQDKGALESTKNVLEQELAQVKSKVQRLESAVVQANGTSSKLAEELENAVQELASKTKEYEALNLEKQNAERSLRLHAQLAQEQFAQKEKSLMEQISSLNGDKNEKAQQINKLTTELATLNQQLKDLKGNQTSHSGRIRQMEDEISKANEELQSLSSSKAALEKELQETKDKMLKSAGEHARTLKQIEDKVDELASSKIPNGLDALQLAMIKFSIEDKAAFIQNKIEQLTELLGQSNSQLSQIVLNNQGEERLREIENLNQYVEQIKDENRLLVLTYEALKLQMDGEGKVHDQVVEKYEEKIAEFNKDLQKAKDEIYKVKSANQELSKDLLEQKKIASENVTSRIDIERRIVEVNELKEELKNLKNCYNQLQNEYNVTQLLANQSIPLFEKVKELEHQITTLQKELQNKQDYADYANEATEHAQKNQNKIAELKLDMEKQQKSYEEQETRYKEQIQELTDSIRKFEELFKLLKAREESTMQTSESDLKNSLSISL